MRKKLLAPAVLIIALVVALPGVAQAVVTVNTSVSISVSNTTSSTTVSGSLRALNPGVPRWHCFVGKRIGVFRNGVFIGHAVTDRTGHYTFTTARVPGAFYFVRFKGFTFMRHPHRIICNASRSGHATSRVRAG